MKIICIDTEEAIAVSGLLTVVCNELKRSPVLDPGVQYSYEQCLLLMRESVIMENSNENK
jgi:hypothetical protein